MGVLEGIAVCRCWRDVEDELGRFGAVGCMAGRFVERGGIADIEFSTKITAQYLPRQPAAFSLFSLQHPVVPTLIRVWRAAVSSNSQSRCAIDVLIADDGCMGMQSACMHVVLSNLSPSRAILRSLSAHTLPTTDHSTNYPTHSKLCCRGADHTKTPLDSTL